MRKQIFKKVCDENKFRELQTQHIPSPQSHPASIEDDRTRMEFMFNASTARGANGFKSSFNNTGQSFIVSRDGSPRIEKMLGIRVERSPNRAKGNMLQYIPIEQVNFKYDQVDSKLIFGHT